MVQMSFQAVSRLVAIHVDEYLQTYVDVRALPIPTVMLLSTKVEVVEVAVVEEEAADDYNPAKAVLHQWIHTDEERQLDAVIYESSLV
jgi:hypothetical protein